MSKRPCLGPGCNRYAKPLKAPHPENPRRWTLKAATEEPAFCTVRCAANWALVHATDNIYCEDAYSWCDKHGWYSTVPYEGECLDCKDEARGE